MNFISGPKNTKIEPGIYEADFTGFDTKIMMGNQAKLYLYFLLETDDGRKIVLAKYYNVNVVDLGKKTFSASTRTSFVRDYVRLSGDKKVLERASSDEIMRFFEGRRFSCVVETVTKGTQNEEIPELLQYSKVKRLRYVIDNNQRVA